MIFIFDGLDGCGKTTYIRRLQDHYELQGKKVKVFRNPGGTHFGETVRPLVKTREVERGKLVDMMTLAANWLDIMEQAKPFIDEGYLVLVDRGPMSAYGYQAGYKGLTRYVEIVYDLLIPLYLKDKELPVPEALFYIDVPFYLLSERLNERTSDTNEMYEGKDEKWYNTIKSGYDKFYQNGLAKRSFSAHLQRGDENRFFESNPIFKELIRVSPTDNTKHEHNRLLTIFKETIDKAMGWESHNEKDPEL